MGFQRYSIAVALLYHIVSLLSGQKFLLDLLIRGGLTVHPRMSHYLLEGKSSLWVKLEHSSDEIFQIVAQRSNRLEKGPEFVRPIAGDVSIETILDRSSFERSTLSTHGE